MKPIRIPANYNYIAVFLTFACNLKCGYCINNFEQELIRRKVISGKDFVLVSWRDNKAGNYKL